MQPKSRRPPTIVLTLALLTAAAATLLTAATPTIAQDEEAPLEPLEISPRNANYRVEVRLDPQARTLDGHQIVVWRNLQARPATELRFHLYWNAWRNNRSTWMREARLRYEKDLARGMAPEDWGWIDIDDIRLGDKSVLAALRIGDPTGENPDDRTVAVLALPVPVEPGETIELELDWRAKVPRTLARTGFRGDDYLVAHWFPKLGVFEPEGWNCHPFHANTEFFSDFGNYDVAITVPARFVVGATGRETLRTPNADGTVTYRYQQDDVHAFTWTTSPDYLVDDRRFEVAGLPQVDLRLLLQPEHRSQADRIFRATEVALEQYGRWYGPYPYAQLTIVDPAFETKTAGMEYPTLFVTGTHLSNPLGGGSPESVTIHEAGHQFWYGLVANNEFEHAWLDEGLNTFSTARALEVAYGPRHHVERYLKPPGVDFTGFLGHLIEDVELSRAVYGNRAARFLASGAATADPQSEASYRYLPRLASRLSYDKTALWLATLERQLGWETLRQILATFFERYRFRHPRPEDFFAVADEVSGRDLGEFFEQVHGRALDFDYAIDSVGSFPATAGFVEQRSGVVYVDPSEDGTPTPYRSEVVVRRLGGGVFPVEVLMVFADGTEIRRSWDGHGRWQLFTEERSAKLDYAIVDPERILLLDLHPTNNSRRLEPQPELAATKWASKWLVRLQDLLQTFTFFL